MTDNRYRPRSPPRTSRYLDPRADPRASTGMFYPSSYDPKYPSQPRSAIEPHQSSRHGSIYDTRPIKSYSYKDDAYPGSTISRTEYAVRPRTNSNVPPDSRRPLSMVAAKNTSPTRRPVVSNLSRDEHRTAPYIAREEPSKYLVPASSHSHGRDHHQRHYSATKGDAEKLNAGGRSSGRTRGEYHQPGGYSQRTYTHDRAPIKDDDYSYTGPREQFARDMQARVPPAREAYVRGERPMSVVEIPDFKAPPPVRRDMPPPPPRQLERLDRPDDRRLSVRPMHDEPERVHDLPSRRHSVRAPVVHQLRDEGYSSAKDDMEFRGKPRRERVEEEPPLPKIRTREPERDYQWDRDYPREPDRDRDRERDRDLRDRDRDRDRERERERERERDPNRERDRDRPHLYEKAKLAEDKREVRSRESSPDRAGMAKGIAAGLGGAAVAGLTGAAIKGSSKPGEASEDDNHKERRHRKHKHRDRSDDVLDPREVDLVERRSPGIADDRVNDDRLQIMPKRDDSASESYEDENQRRRRRRRKHRDRDELDSVNAIDPRGGPINLSRPERELAEEEEFEKPRRRRERPVSRTREAEDPELDRRTISPGEDDDDRPRRVQLVEPERKEEFRPRGILKKPRLVPFPEDPNPTREGVAPLKDAGKDGVPVGARWTKISRVLVNPEALEKAHERFEERDDYVIVLRVVTREEIQKFAEKTRELRGKSILRSGS